MSTATLGSGSTSTSSEQPWWRRALVSFGIGLAVFTPLVMWLRRRRNHQNS